MKALRALAPGGEQTGVVEVARPSQPEPGEVLVATRGAGVCGSDVHAWHGTQTYPMKYPVTLGHEAVGVVAEVGPGVSAFRTGDRVVSETARTVCGTCCSCREGRYNLCADRLGFGALYDGAMAEAFVSRALRFCTASRKVSPIKWRRLPSRTASLTMLWSNGRGSGREIR